MKKVSVILLAICLMTAIGVQAKPGLTVGASYWNATYEYSGSEEEAGNLFGPYASLKFDKISLSAAILSGEYKYEYFGYEITMKRSDVSLSLGYSINRNVTLFGAYKSTKFDYEDIDGEEPNNYAGGGISIMFPFTGTQFFVYGSWAYLAALEDEEKYLLDISTLSLGVGYYTSAGLTIMVGYRSDTFKADDDYYDDDTKEKGFLATIAYTFR